MNKKSKKEQIMQSAIQIFSQKGFAASKIKDIADRAGIGKGTVYEYFDSKEELFYETISYITDCFAKSFNDLALADSLSIREKVKEMTYHTLVMMKKNKEMVSVIINEISVTLMTGDTGRTGDAGNIGIPFYRRISDLLYNALVEGMSRKEIREVDPALLTEMLLSYLHFLAFRIVCMEENLDLKILSENAIDILWKGIQC